MIALGLDYIFGIILSDKFFLKLKKYSLSEVYFNTGRLLFEFNGLQYRFAVGYVFVALLVYRLGKASTTPETQTLIASFKPHPLR